MTEYPQIGVRVDEEFLKRIDDWRRKQEDLPGRPEAIRRLVEIGLKAHTPEPKAIKRLRERVAGAAELAAKAVDSFTGPSQADVARHGWPKVNYARFFQLHCRRVSVSFGSLFGRFRQSSAYRCCAGPKPIRVR
jgi:hypothetical protein